ncbi:ribonuclease HII [Nakamurella silvestris]|nr:ribonuclease HII [Nakamurella silvestris]
MATTTLRPLTGFRPDLRMEKKLLKGGVVRLAAMDEVGRGALAGPVTVGVVIVTASVGRVPQGLRDSKLLSAARREALVTPIRRWAPQHGVGHATADEIDTVGIMRALRLAGERALALAGDYDAVLLDGNHNWLTPPATLFEFDLDGETGSGGDEVPPARTDAPVHLRIKADLSCATVAAASVLAKTERDRIMTELGPEHPEFGFDINKGYGTPEHKDALRRLGPSAVHRRSWRLGLS